jgi:hypothetical protein
MSVRNQLNLQVITRDYLILPSEEEKTHEILLVQNSALNASATIETSKGVTPDFHTKIRCLSYVRPETSYHTYC